MVASMVASQIAGEIQPPPSMAMPRSLMFVIVLPVIIRRAWPRTGVPVCAQIPGALPEPPLLIVLLVMVARRIDVAELLAWLLMNRFTGAPHGEPLPEQPLMALVMVPPVNVPVRLPDEACVNSTPTKLLVNVPPLMVRVRVPALSVCPRTPLTRLVVKLVVPTVAVMVAVPSAMSTRPLLDVAALSWMLDPEMV